MSAPILSVRHPEALARSESLLRAGELVVIPTDTVYGIATLPVGLDDLLERIYGAYDAVPWPALPLLIASTETVPQLARSNRAAERIARHFWPGKVTVLLPAAPDFPFPLQTPRVALRIPNFPPIFPLIEAMGGYLIVGRAAHPGYPSSITAREAASQLGEDVALILDGGPSPFGITSTVVDCIETPPRVVQRGAVADDKIEAVLRDAETLTPREHGNRRGAQKTGSS